MICDFRSDTVTKPTAGMREAMMTAELGDDVYGEDPTVNALEAETAQCLGKEAALFVPSGTMANQLAIHLHCRPGDSVLIEEDSHCFIYEVGAGAALSGVQFDQVPFCDDMSAAAIQTKYRSASLHSAQTRLMVLENTHNRNGGEARSPQRIAEICGTGRQLGLALHCDGARLWNAAIRFNVSERDLAAPFDSLAVCFSKGLGAPVGSALVGTKEFIGQARRIRKRWGGAMRQAGVLAAAARYALKNHRRRLSEDHGMIDRLTQGLVALNQKQGGSLQVRALKAATNMVYVQLAAGTADRLVAAAREKNLLFQHVGQDQLRLVAHMDLPAEAVDRILRFFSEFR